MIKTTALRLIAAFVLFAVPGFSQGDDEPESPPPPPADVATQGPVLFKVIEGELTAASQQMPDKHYYQYIQVPMYKGDKIIIRYESKDFIVGLGIMDTLGHQTQQQDQPVMFERFGSKLVVPFHAVEDALMNFVFTSSQAEKTGKFTVKIYYYSAAQNKLTDDSPVCEKLKYLAESAVTNFEFLKKPYRLDKKNDFCPATLKLFPEAEENQIQSTFGGTYRVRFRITQNLDSLNKVFDGLEQEFTTCLSDHAKVIHDKTNNSTFGKDNFIRQVSFTKKPGDPNSFNYHTDYRDQVELSLEKVFEKGYYVLKVDIN